MLTNSVQSKTWVTTGVTWFVDNSLMKEAAFQDSNQEITEKKTVDIKKRAQLYYIIIFLYYVYKCQNFN